MDIDRRQATSEQIEVAVELLAASRSAISAHLLAWAAFDVLRAIAKSRGIRSMTDTVIEMVPVSHRGDVWKELKRHYNFAKHADLDPAAIVERFDPETTAMILWLAIGIYWQAYDRMTPAMGLYWCWFLKGNPELTDASARTGNTTLADHGRAFPFPASVLGLQSALATLREDDEGFEAFVPGEAV